MREMVIQLVYLSGYPNYVRSKPSPKENRKEAHRLDINSQCSDLPTETIEPALRVPEIVELGLAIVSFKLLSSLNDSP